MRTRNPFRYGSRVTGGAFFDRERIIRDMLELPAKICPAGRTLVVFDEFQEVESLGLGQQFERTMRSVIQNQPDIAYVFLGSKTHMLERMFASPSRPFYNSAQKFPLLVYHLASK